MVIMDYWPFFHYSDTMLVTAVSCNVEDHLLSEGIHWLTPQSFQK